jgi:hypothetical protein
MEAANGEDVTAIMLWRRLPQGDQTGLDGSIVDNLPRR